MSLSVKLSPDQHAALPEELRDAYRQASDGSYIIAIDVDSHPDVAGLRQNSDALKREKLKLAEELESLKRHTSEAEIKRMEDQSEWKGIAERQKKEHEGAVSALTKQIEGLKSQLTKELVERQALEIATELAGESAALMLPHVMSRLKPEFTETGELKVHITDAAGHASSMDKDSLVNDFKNNKLFAPIIRGVQSSGSGANAGRGGAPAEGGEWAQYFDPAGGRMNATKQAELRTSDPDLYQRMRERFPIGEGQLGVGTTRVNVIRGR